MTTPKLHAARAGVAERAIRSRHLRSVWGLPGTALGLNAWPPDLGVRAHRSFGYWWQAHLVDCVVDAQLRAPRLSRATLVEQLVRGLRVRNLTGWTNDYYDDVAWLGLALQRAAGVGVPRPRAVEAVATRLREGLTDHGGGGLWWRRGDDFKNVPANGPAAIFFARRARASGDRADLGRARSIVDWVEDNLADPETGLVWDGLHLRPDGSVREVERVLYTYCQGVHLGACLEIARSGGGPRWADRAARVIAGVDRELAADRVLRGHGGGDGGLFSGILARYLAQAALHLDRPEAVLAAELVVASAEAAWANRSAAVSGPLFGPDWARPTGAPEAGAAERDLSVQLGGWMVLEAAALLEERGRVPRRRLTARG
ncbi:glycoside hydrolase [Actinosynnema pretiosum subsp. pretiosum]|uniref:Glycoside hydrolase family 76 n=2 Tax=Actinosynnema TaxID=40566 RepID=C6WR34_ACTMD|nr:glycoside hydrolase family 76 protein [Actinosynnema mirum]ACU40727.1 glycoside hydrolase family 76 [Actinosynnema mirum DSM 43827]AXX34231.1 fructose-bisphosphate aldolase family protein [Actinosynnema pretiosum subsp. pretiosum]QUF02050.1 glycoside hydrolase [Actinosynnema pretiosum subsp. pretiosum]